MYSIGMPKNVEKQKVQIQIKVLQFIQLWFYVWATYLVALWIHGASHGHWSLRLSLPSTVVQLIGTCWFLS